MGAREQKTNAKSTRKSAVDATNSLSPLFRILIPFAIFHLADCPFSYLGNVAVLFLQSVDIAAQNCDDLLYHVPNFYVRPFAAELCLLPAFCHG